MYLSYNVLHIYFMFSCLKYSNSVTIYSPSISSNFKNFAILSSFVDNLDYMDDNDNERKRDCTFLDILALEDHSRLCLLPFDIKKNKLVQNMSIFLPQHEFNLLDFYDLSNFSVNFFRGYILEKPYTSSLSGFTYNNNFYGKIHTGKHTYYIEPLSKYKTISRGYDNAEQKSILYEAEDVDSNYNANYDSAVEEYEEFWEHMATERPLESSEKEKAELWRGKCCSLLVLVDYTYFKEIGNSNLNFTLMQILDTLLFANSVFGTTDFDDDGQPDNVGFYVKYLAILNTVESHNLYFKHETVHAVDAMKYLDMFAKFNEFGDVCLRVLFTAQPFLDNKLSTSYIFPESRRKLRRTHTYGSICKKHSYNSIIITHYIDYGDYVPVFITDLTLIHELGHALGSPHDDTTCWGYVMSVKIKSSLTKNHFTFSNCSKINMLTYIQERSYCFEDWLSSSHCGNGLIEPGEECDCGLSYDCNNEEICCVAHDGKDTPCHVDVQSGFDCVPNQGFCCSKDCQYLDLSAYQINCRNEIQKCPCAEKTSFCTCGHAGICVGNYCHSKECVYSGLLECVCHMSKTLYCETCCLNPEGKCMPLSEINEVYVNESNPILNALENVEHISYESLGHRIWQNNEICVSFGKTGYCQLGVCDLYAPAIVLKSLSQILEGYNEKFLQEKAMSKNNTSEDIIPKSRFIETPSYIPDSAVATNSVGYSLLFIIFYGYMLL